MRQLNVDQVYSYNKIWWPYTFGKTWLQKGLWPGLRDQGLRTTCAMPPNMLKLPKYTRTEWLNPLMKLELFECTNVIGHSDSIRKSHNWAMQLPALTRHYM